jgi:hypothetical protein
MLEKAKEKQSVLAKNVANSNEFVLVWDTNEAALCRPDK